MTGFGHVFRFTLVQTLKNKGFLASAILMILVMSLMKPFSYLMTKSSEKTANAANSVSLNQIEADRMIIFNDTSFTIDLMDVTPDEKPEAGKLTVDGVKVFNKGEADFEVLTQGLGEKDILVYIQGDEKEYKVNAIVSDNTKLQVRSMDKAADLVKKIFSDDRKKQMKLDDSTIKSISSGVQHGGVLTEEEEKLEKDKTMGKTEYSGIMMAFDLLIMMVASLSASYIIASVNEEKSSKLAESLLVSVRPMALLMGKIIGMLTFITTTLILGVCGSMVANLIMTNVMKLDTSSVNQGGLNLAVFTGYGFVGFIILFVEVILALCSFGVLSGIMGSACSKTEDQQSATSIVMMLTMVGYLATAMVGTQDKYTLILALVPPVSYFNAPIAYIGGRISLPVLLGSFAIQIALLVGLVMLAAKTYRNLLLSDSSRPKLAAIFQAAKM